VGAIGGPVGMVVGGAIGAVAGGLAGKGVAEAIDPTAEDEYWRENYADEPYAVSDASYDDYAPAYRVGYTGRGEYDGRSFEEVEPDLQQRWESDRGNSNLTWEKAKHASRAAWDRIERAIPGDSDRDGK
jgi:hypothetical protein